jgi:predicted transcriptional regulator
MVKKVIPKLIRKYDIANKIFQEFGDLESRYILFSIIKKPKSIQEISEELKIPLSIVYKKIQNLEKVSLLSVERAFLGNGRVIKLYQSKVNEVQIDISKVEPVISLNKNPILKT